ncbi:DegT/DnrJ/EryC1/StrS family aminotransferase [Bacteroidota bacterium]
MKKKCEEKLKELTGKNYIVFTRRGNSSILASLKLMKELGFQKVIIQEQGGWITYPQFIERLKFECERIITDYGIIKGIEDNDAVLLCNSMPGYFALQNMSEVSNFASEKKLFLINDVSGSIGTEEAKIGDLIIGSFGRWKPLNVEEGGFIATNDEEHYNYFKEFEEKINFEKLHQKLSNLKSKLEKFDEISSKIKTDLSDFHIIHKDLKGINVIARFISDEEKEKLIKYCNEKNYTFVECPKYIRVLDDAISIEVKRLDL